MKVELAKGVRDYPPEEQILRQDVIAKIRKVFERYGYSPLETPIIERLDMLTAKFGAGEGTDVMKEIFRLTDQGGRLLGLKFDMTVPLARFIAMNPTIKLPFRRYAIDRAFRDGPIKLGRDREFYQCDADIVGCRRMSAETELISLAFDVYKELSLDAYLEINSRSLLYAIMDVIRIKRKDEAAIVIDKIKKVSKKDLLLELEGLGIAPDDGKRFLDMVSMEGNPEDVLNRLASEGIKEEYLKDLREIFRHPRGDVRLNLALARGLNYYTGTVMEAFLKDSKITSSVSGGGRYDGMIGDYVGRGEYPAVGISFGLVPIIEAIRLSGYNTKKTVTEVLIIPIGDGIEADRLAGRLRSEGINTEMDMLRKGISKSLNYANHYAIPYCIFLGEEEIRKKTLRLKDMNSGEEKEIKEAEVIRILKARSPR